MHVQLVGPERVGHDFALQPICVVDLVVKLRNLLPAPVAVQVQTGVYSDGTTVAPGVSTWSPLPPAAAAAAGSPDGASFGAEAASLAETQAAAPVRQHVWCGSTRTTLQALPAGAEIEVPLQVAATRPGWLALADYAVSWRHLSGQEGEGSMRGDPCFVQVCDAS